MQQPDGVTAEEAYAAALVEIARLQERLILGQALISRLKKEANDGPTRPGNTGDDRSDDPTQHFSD
jgi:hypothetical protein